jgi:hypothetical protein
MGMYRIEMWIESGQWTVRVPANRAQAERTKNRRLRHNQYQWEATGGRWVPLGGLYADEAAAEWAMARMMGTGSWAKPKVFRCFKV